MELFESLPKRVAEHFQLTPCSLVVAGTPSKEAWIEAGALLGKISRSAQWWIGDWLLCGQERNYISRTKYNEAEAATGYDRRTLQQLAWIAGKFESSLRREDLTFRHHKEAAALPEPGRSKLLEEAATAGWSVSVLRHKIGERNQAKTEVLSPRAMNRLILNSFASLLQLAGYPNEMLETKITKKVREFVFNARDTVPTARYVREVVVAEVDALEISEERFNKGRSLVDFVRRRGGISIAKSPNVPGELRGVMKGADGKPTGLVYAKRGESADYMGQLATQAGFHTPSGDPIDEGNIASMLGEELRRKARQTASNVKMFPTFDGHSAHEQRGIADGASPSAGGGSTSRSLQHVANPPPRIIGGYRTRRWLW